MHSRFSFLSSRIVQKRKAWLAEALELRGPAEIPIMLGKHWWFHFGAALCEVIMPPEFYQVGAANNLQWDEIGLKASERDWASWPGTPSDDLMLRSQFNLFRDIGQFLYANPADALRFALERIAMKEARCSSSNHGGVKPPQQMSLAYNKVVK